MKRYINLCILAAITLFLSCAEDKGNYDYRSINELTIKGIPEDTTAMHAEVLKIQPVLERLLENTEEGLEYSWTMAGEEIATTRDLNYEISLTWDVKKYDCMYTVTDTKNGMKYFQKFNLNVVASFSWGYYFLCEEADGTSVLSYFSSKEGTKECLHTKQIGSYSLGKRPRAILDFFGNIDALDDYYYTMYIINGESDNQVIITNNGSFTPSGLITNESLIDGGEPFEPEYGLTTLMTGNDGKIYFISNGKFYTYASGLLYRPAKHDKEYYWSHPASAYSYFYAFDDLSKKFYILKNQINDPAAGLVQDPYALDRVVEIENQPSFEGHKIIVQSVDRAHTMYAATVNNGQINLMTFTYIDSQKETEEQPALNEYGCLSESKTFPLAGADSHTIGAVTENDWYFVVGNKIYTSPVKLPVLTEFTNLPDDIGTPMSVAFSSKGTHLIVATYDENSKEEYKGSFALVNLTTKEVVVHRNVMGKCMVAKGYDANPWW